MTTPAQHHFTFRVEANTFGVGGYALRSFRVGVEADSHAEGLNAVSAHFPEAKRIYLSSIERIGDGCGDDRCAVCNPSSRNKGTL